MLSLPRLADDIPFEVWHVLITTSIFILRTSLDGPYVVSKFYRTVFALILLYLLYNMDECVEDRLILSFKLF